MLPVIITLYVLAAALPIAGFGRLLWRADRRLRALDAEVARRGVSDHTFADFNRDHAGDVRDPLRAERRDLLWDTALVGVGLIAGAVASICSLCVAA